MCLITLIQSCSLQIDESDMGTSDRKKTGHREITTHVSIHTIHLDGLRELYRHFLRLPDGAVVEVSILRINFCWSALTCVHRIGESRPRLFNRWIALSIG